MINEKGRLLLQEGFFRIAEIAQARFPAYFQGGNSDDAFANLLRSTESVLVATPSGLSELQTLYLDAPVPLPSLV